MIAYEGLGSREANAIEIGSSDEDCLAANGRREGCSNLEGFRISTEV